MIHSQARLTGHLELVLLDPNGGVLARHENHNSVMPFGAELLLKALQGQASVVRMEPFLGNERIRPDAEEGLEGRGVIRLKEPEQLDPQQEGGKLAMSYRAIASEDAKVIGGGLGVIYRAKGSNKQLSGIYNFARTRSAVEVRAEMPLLLNFTLSVA